MPLPQRRQRNRQEKSTKSGRSRIVWLGILFPVDHGHQRFVRLSARNCHAGGVEEDSQKAMLTTYQFQLAELDIQNGRRWICRPPAVGICHLAGPGISRCPEKADRCSAVCGAYPDPRSNCHTHTDTHSRSARCGRNVPAGTTAYGCQRVGFCACQPECLARLKRYRTVEVDGMGTSPCASWVCKKSCMKESGRRDVRSFPGRTICSAGCGSGQLPHLGKVLPLWSQLLGCKLGAGDRLFQRYLCLCSQPAGCFRGDRYGKIPPGIVWLHGQQLAGQGKHCDAQSQLQASLDIAYDEIVKNALDTETEKCNKSRATPIPPQPTATPTEGGGENTPTDRGTHPPEPTPTP